MHKTNKEEFEIMTPAKLKEACEWLEFYDKNRFFPFEKKAVLFTISGHALLKMSKVKNKSKYINNLILSN
jgi:hypothetical protein